MTKQIGLLSLAIVLLLSGCIPALERSEEEVIVVEETNEEEAQEYVITPTIDTVENFYRNVLQDGTYHRSEARGVVAHAMNNRIDINQFELGLMEIASGVHNQQDYFFREGQFLSGERINRWLRRYDPENSNNVDGLNPQLANQDTMEERMRYSPLYLSHIMEHNYYYGSEEEGVNLGGVVIGLSLRSMYYFRTEDDAGLIYTHEEPVDIEYAIERGREAAQIILERMRQMNGLEEVPITFALYHEEKRGSVVPGKFISMTEVGSEQMEIQEWEAISEDFFVFPSSTARNAQPNLSSAFSQFRTDIERFFDRTVGVVGKGRFKNEMLEELKIEVNLQSHGKAEIVALTQYISGRINSTFSVQSPIYIYINSINGPEAIIVQHPEEDPYIHIYK